MTKEAVRTAIEDIYKFLNDNKLYPDDIYQFEDLPAIAVHLRWGDWKHEHLRLKYLMTEVRDYFYVRSETTDEDGSDCYSATHYFVIHE